MSRKLPFNFYTLLLNDANDKESTKINKTSHRTSSGKQPTSNLRTPARTRLPTSNRALQKVKPFTEKKIQQKQVDLMELGYVACFASTTSLILV